MSKTQEAKSEELLEHIRETYLLKDLDEETLQDLSHDLSWVILDPGENLFRQGDESDSTYLLIEGALQVATWRAPSIKR